MTRRSVIRPQVRQDLALLLVASPSGRTIEEMRSFLVTQRPASRATIERALDDMRLDGLVTVQPEPTWRRKARVRLTKHKAGTALRGRTHHLFHPTLALRQQIARQLTDAFPDAPAHPPRSPEVLPHGAEVSV